MATTDTNVPQVIVNKLTAAQYAAATKSPTEFYAVTDAPTGGEIPFGQCDNTSTNTAYTATIPGITELKDGVCMWLKNGVVNCSSNGYTIDVNGLGAKPVYHNMGASSKDTVAFGSAYTYLFVYDSTRVAGGCWVQDRGYYENNQAYRIRPQYSQQPVTDQTGRYRLLFTSPSGDKLIPANSSNSTSETIAKTVNQRAIDPFGPILYYSSTNIVAADGIPAAGGIWYAYQLYIGYSFADGNTPTMTTGSPVYLKCAPQSDGSAIIDSTTPYVQTLPNTEDGKIYIYLGFAASARQLELISTHPIYYYKDNSIRIWTNQAQGGGTTYTAGSHIDITSDVISAIDYVSADSPTAAVSPSSPVTTPMIADGAVTSAKIATGVVPQITMTNVDPGEGTPLAENNFIAVYDTVGSLIDMFYPVGSYYETSNTAFNPNIAWGGTWVEDSVGKVTVAQDTNDADFDTIGETGGEKAHQLINDELPKLHGEAQVKVYDAYQTSGIVSGKSWSGTKVGATNNNSQTPFGFQIDFGQDAPHNNVQPYVVVKRWHRTA